MSVPEGVLVVSGLPRSGTSLMMQMLCAGGVPVLCDENRSSDRWNPFGYYEYTPAKALEFECGWVEQARGQAVKVVAPLLRFLPGHIRYTIVFMVRDIGDMYRSQLRMMGGRGSGVWSQNDVAAYLLDVRDWLVAWDGATTAFVQYEALLRSPRAQAQMLERLLNRQLDIDAMVAAVHSETR